MTVFIAERGDRARCFPGVVEKEFHHFNALKLNAARQSSEIWMAAYCSDPEAREGTSAGDLMGLWGWSSGKRSSGVLGDRLATDLDGLPETSGRKPRRRGSTDAAGRG